MSPIAPTPQAAEATHAAATERGKRALWQGLAIDVLTAIAAALLLWLPDADLAARDAWIALGTGLVRTILGAVASYVMRLKMAPLKEAELVEGAYLITDLDTGKGTLTNKTPPTGE